MNFAAPGGNFVSPFFSLKAKGRWLDEIDGETRAIPKSGFVPELVGWICRFTPW